MFGILSCTTLPHFMQVISPLFSSSTNLLDSVLRQFLFGQDKSFAFSIAGQKSHDRTFGCETRMEGQDQILSGQTPQKCNKCQVSLHKERFYFVKDEIVEQPKFMEFNVAPVRVPKSYCSFHIDLPVMTDITYEIVFNTNVKEKPDKVLLQLANLSYDSLKSSQTSSIFTSFPRELLVQIFSNLTLRCRIRMKLACKLNYQRLHAWSPQPLIMSKVIVSKHERWECDKIEYPKILLSLQKPEYDESTTTNDELVYSSLTQENGKSTVKLIPEDKEEPSNLYQYWGAEKIVPDPTGPFKSNFVYSWDRESNHSAKYLCGTKNLTLKTIRINTFGGSCVSTVLPKLHKKKVTYYCFNSTAPIKLADGSFIDAKDIQIGDELMAADGSMTTVQKIKTTSMYSKTKMIELEDFDITIGHPIYYEGDWYRPDEIFEPVVKYIEVLYNFHCQPSQSIVVGREKEYICSSLGSYCPRIAEKDPYTDIIFGRGYGTPLAERYSWLLYLNERVPDDQVERLTDLYWETVKLEKEQQLNKYHSNTQNIDDCDNSESFLLAY